MNTESLRDTIAPKSDQLNADDLMAGPITVEITSVSRGTSEQPVSVSIAGGYQPYKPCKSMRRVMIALWGDNGADWVGKKMTLYCDQSVKFGGVKVGGIRISHVSGITQPHSLMLTTARSKRSEFTVKPLIDTQAEYEAKALPALQAASLGGIEALQMAFEKLEASPLKSSLWASHSEKLKEAASISDGAPANAA